MSRDTAHYLNKVENPSVYYELSEANCVFVVTPDYVHSEVASFWLDRLAPEGKIFIEKPLDASLASAQELKKKITKKETVFAFDHYRARSYPFLKHKDDHLKIIGGMDRIKFHILEDSGIPLARAKALDKGMIFDLFCHCLAVLFAFEEPQNIKLNEVKAARYIDSPITGDTFAYISFFMNNKIQVDSSVGKFVGTSQEKFMKIIGASGEIYLDFLNDTFYIIDLQGHQIEKGDLNSNHVESFIDKVLSSNCRPCDVPGIFSFNIAYEILTVLHESIERISWLPSYEHNSTLDQVLKK